MTRSVKSKPKARYVPYPSLDDPGFNEVIARKYEFNRFVSSGSAPSVTCERSSFSLTSQQRIAAAFMSPFTPYNGLLVFHGTGTGKTCTAITIAEQFNTVFQKRHYVLCSSALKDNFKRQIFDETKENQCTGSAYLQKDNPTSQESPAEMIKQRWEIRSFNEFAKAYKRLLDLSKKKKANFDRLLKDAFSNRVFVVDEAHNVRLSNEAKEKEVPPKLEHVMRVAENVKLLLLTATPMYNTASEIVFLLNLLLRNDGRPTLDVAEVFDTNEKLTPQGRDRLVDASRGYVSVNSADNPYTFPLRLYPDANRDKMMVKRSDTPKTNLFGKSISTYGPVDEFFIRKSYMVGHQNTAYERLSYGVKEADEAEANDDDLKASHASRMGVLVQVSNIAYPCDTSSVATARYAYGKEGFAACFQEHVDNGVYKLSYRTGLGEFLKPDTLEQHSAKIKTIVEYIKNSTGVVFVYSAYLYSGLVPLAVALEHEGFTKYGNRNLLKKTAGAPKLKMDGATATYAMITGAQTFSPNNAREIAVARDAKNAQGRVIKVILASNVATEGVDFKFIREVHVLEPWYHFNKLEQAFGRAIRHCSHSDLPPRLRNATLYQHASFRKEARETIDMRMYNIAISKQVTIDEVTTLLKATAVNALLQERRFPRTPEVVEITTSQGRSAKYTIRAQASPERVRAPDKSTFNPFMARADIEAYQGSIKKVFAEGRCAHSYVSLRGQVMPGQIGFDEEVFIHALHDMVVHPAPFTVRERVGVLSYVSDKYVLSYIDGKRPKQMHMDACDDGPSSHLLTRKVRLSAAETPNTPSAQTQSTKEENPDEADVMGLVRDVGSLIDERARASYMDVIIDFVLDRLPCARQMKLIESMGSKNLVWERLQALPQFLNKKYFVDFENAGAYYILTNNRFERSPVLQQKHISKIEEGIAVDEGRSLLGFLVYEKEQYRFKMLIKDGKKDVRHLRSFGSACATTSTIQVGEMKAQIAELHGGGPLLAKDKTPKKGLCDVYEIVARKHRPDMMMRPYNVFLVNRRKK